MGGLLKVEKESKLILPHNCRKKHQPAGALILDFQCLDYKIMLLCYLKPLSCGNLLQQQYETNTLITGPLKQRQGGKRWSTFLSWDFMHLGMLHTLFYVLLTWKGPTFRYGYQECDFIGEEPEGPEIVNKLHKTIQPVRNQAEI